MLTDSPSPLPTHRRPFRLIDERTLRRDAFWAPDQRGHNGLEENTICKVFHRLGKRLSRAIFKMRLQDLSSQTWRMQLGRGQWRG